MLTSLFFPNRDPQQSHRMRRWVMASSASGMVVLLFLAAYLLGLLDLRDFLTAAAFVLGFVILFYVIFRSGLNLRFRDPSLTLTGSPAWTPGSA